MVEAMFGPAAYFFGYLGVAVALVFSNLGTAYGTTKAGVGVMATGVMNHQIVIKLTLPVVMAGIFGIYGLILAVVLNGSITPPSACDQTTGDGCYTYAQGYRALAAGLCLGLSNLGAGMTIGIVGDAGVRAIGQQQKLYVGMLLVLIFAEALALYGLIVALVLSLG